MAFHESGSMLSSLLFWAPVYDAKSLLFMKRFVDRLFGRDAISVPFYFKDLLKLPLFYNAWYMFGGNLIPGILGFIFWTLASRLYSTTDVGIASAVISAASFVSITASLGTNMGLIRFLPETPRPRDLINSVFGFNIVFSLLFGLLFLGGLSVWAVRLQPAFEDASFSALFFVFLISSTLGTSIRDTFVAYRRSDHALVYTLIVNVIRLLLLAVGKPFGFVGLVGAVAAGFLVAFLVSMFFLSSRVSSEIRWSPRFSWLDIQPMALFSISNFITIIILNMTPTVIPLMTLQILGPEANAHSYMVLMIGALLTSPGVALATSAFVEGSNDISRYRIILRRALIVALAITFAGSAILALLTSELLLWFGPAYVQEGATLLRVLAFTAPLVVLNQMFFTYMRLENKTGSLVVTSLVQVFSTLAISNYLLPFVGIIANGIAIFIGNLLVSMFIVATLPRIIRIRNWSI